MPSPQPWNAASRRDGSGSLDWQRDVAGQIAANRAVQEITRRTHARRVMRTRLILLLTVAIGGLAAADWFAWLPTGWIRRWTSEAPAVLKAPPPPLEAPPELKIRPLLQPPPPPSAGKVDTLAPVASPDHP